MGPSYQPKSEEVKLVEFLLTLTETELNDYHANRKVVKTNGKSEFVLVPNPDNYHQGQYVKRRQGNKHTGFTPKKKKRKK